MQQETETIIQEILQKIVPSGVERKKMKRIAAELERKVSIVCEDFGVEAIVRVEGSVAKDTWLKGDPDIDVFMRLPITVPRNCLGEISLKVARKATEGSKQVERFAEHPYLEAFVENTRVNIVPCYDAKPGEWLSATDRTPFHTDYISDHMNQSMHDEVRLLKKFMKGIGVYGAELKIGGFSGYLCELLTLHYGSFKAVLQSFSQHTSKRIADIEKYYEHRAREIELLFPEPLVIVDPVDKGRNVASAVQPQKLYTFIAASRAFLKTPRQEFFFPPKTTPLSLEELKRKLKNHNSAMIFLTFDEVKTVPDILWGQLYKTRRSLRKLLELNGFKVIREGVWSEEDQGCTVFVFELEQQTLSVAKKHLGPPLEHERDCETFLEKYTRNKKVISGPYIENGRWIVHVPRRHTNAVELLKMKLKDGGRDVGVAELVAHSLRKEFTVLINNEITQLYADKASFAEFLTEFFTGVPFWL